MLDTTNDTTNGQAMAASAEAAALVWCRDEEAGIRRVKSGKGFSYKTAKGDVLKDARTLDRIKALVIPPAWTDVWIAPRADCHMQVTGRDARGRKQYRYHERWTACRDEAKYGNLTEFARALPKLRLAIEADLRTHGLGRDKVLATVVWLLDNVMIRVGNSAYARDNNSFGLTTLRDRHADISGSTLRLSFKGKSGKEWNVRIADRRIARIVKGAQDLPGQHLFQYLDEDGQRRSIASGDVNDYIRRKSGGAFSSKHFRTWGGTVLAATWFAEADRPDNQAGQARMRNEVIDRVAGKLGNTRAVCRKCYIHPRIFTDWEVGRLATDLKAIGQRFRASPRGLVRMEALVLRLLEKKPARKRKNSSWT